MHCCFFQRNQNRSHRTHGGLFASLLIGITVQFAGVPSAAASELKYARNFQIQEQDGYRLITVSQPYEGAGDVQYRYVLYPRGSERPLSVQADAYVEVPVRRAIVLSTTFLAALDILDSEDQLVGVGAHRYVNTPSVLERIAHGHIIEVGSETMKNLELMVSAEPEVIFTNIVGSPDYDIHPGLDAMGIASVITAAYMERNLLARAEWIKFLAAFFGNESAAIAHFDAVEARYLTLREQVESIAERPSVLANVPWGNVWYIPSGTSFLANLIRDAGGQYLWSDLHTEGPAPMDFESVYARAIDAEVWINCGYLNTLEAMRAQDERYLDFRAVKAGRIFSETGRVGEGGGNDIWERGFAWPDEILADVVHMLHPDLLPEHELIYYRWVR